MLQVGMDPGSVARGTELSHFLQTPHIHPVSPRLRDPLVIGGHHPQDQVLPSQVGSVAGMMWPQILFKKLRTVVDYRFLYQSIDSVVIKLFIVYCRHKVSGN